MVGRHIAYHHSVTTASLASRLHHSKDRRHLQSHSLKPQGRKIIVGHRAMYCPDATDFATPVLDHLSEDDAQVLPVGDILCPEVDVRGGRDVARTGRSIKKSEVWTDG